MPPTIDDESPPPSAPDSRSEQASKRRIWEEFKNDQALIRAYNISPSELAALSQVAMLGEVHSRNDLVFMLSAIRRKRTRYSR